MANRYYFHGHVRVVIRGLFRTYFLIDAPELNERGWIPPDGDYQDVRPISEARAMDPFFGDPSYYEPYHLDPNMLIEISVNHFLYTLYQDGSERPGYHTLICALESIELLTPGASFDFDNQCGGSRFPSHPDFGDPFSGFPVYPDELYIKVRNMVYNIGSKGIITQYQLNQL